jgi:NADPH:quinone reductase-like Zn-dependent oxidoreductase
MDQQWQLEQFGRDQLRLVKAAPREPGPTQVLVRVRAASLNYRDLLMAHDGMGLPVRLPFVPGSDMSGEVIAVGTRVTRFATGDRVIGTFWSGWLDGERPASAIPLGGPGPGVFATQVVLDEEALVHAPKGWSHAQASTLPCAGLTAWTALVELGRLRAGQTVLVHGTGGVALFCVQWARLHGARAIVVTSSPAKAQPARELGAHVLMRSADWLAGARDITGGRGVDHVVETAGGDNLAASMEALAAGGRVSVIGMLAGTELRLPFYPLILKRATVQGIGVGHRRSLEELVRAAGSSELRPVIAHEYGFDQLPQALAHLERGAFGKVVVHV